MSAPRASVVIPMWNAADTLAVQLEALAEQVDAPPFEVIVADNGSTDDSLTVAESFQGRLDLRIVDASARRGPAFARNHGFAAAASENILFCDADDRVEAGWVAAMCRALQQHRLVTGPVIYVDRSSLSGGVPPMPHKVPTAPRRYMDQVPFAASANLAAKVSVLHAVNGFDCELRCGQDADLTIRAQMAGNPLTWAQDAVVFHSRRDSLSAAARQFFRYGYYNARIYRKLRGSGLRQRAPWQMLRPYLVLLATPYRLFTRRRWSWVVNASQRAGRLVGSLRFRVFCP